MDMPASIPMTELAAYCIMVGIGGEDAKTYMYFIRCMDDAWLQAHLKKHRAKKGG